MVDRHCSNGKCLATRHRRSNIVQWPNMMMLYWVVSHMFYNVWAKVRRRSNLIKHHQTNCPNAKMCRQHRIIHGVWSPNISRLDRAERSLPWHFQVWHSMIYIIHRCSHLRWTFSNSSSSSALIPPERPTYALSCRGTIFLSEWASTGKLMFFSRNSFVTCSPTWEGQQMRCNVSWEPDRSSGGM